MPVMTSNLGVVCLVEGVTEEIEHFSHYWILSLGENLKSACRIGDGGILDVVTSMEASFWTHGTDGNTWVVVKRLVRQYQRRVFLESMVVGLVGLPRSGGSRSILDMQVASDETFFPPSQDKSGACHLPLFMSFSPMLLKLANKLVAMVIDSTCVLS
jgi:hypothetical protein